MGGVDVFARRFRSAFACLAVVVAIQSPGLAQLEYTNQNSNTTFYHSGIVTSTGVVWDTDFATNLVGKALPNNQSFNEVGFAFMECYGGGMIDELLNRNLAFASYTSAARSDQVAWAYDAARRGVIANYESTYNLPYAPVAGGAPPTFTLQQAAVVGRNNDMFGPVQNLGPVLFPAGVGVPPRPVAENPQYTSSGPVGDTITLHNPNPNNGVANTKYLAVVFGGSTAETGNTNSVAKIQAALTARGYAAAEIRTVAPGGTAAQLAAAWTFVKNNTTPTTQIYYWNSWGHGSLGFDLVGFIKNLLGGAAPVRGFTYNFGLTSSFVTDMVAHFNYVQGLGDPNPIDAPYLEIQTASLNDGIGVTLNGHTLTPVSSLPFDLYGDGSEYDYRFALTNADIAALSNNDSVSLNWTGNTPNFGLGELNVGDLTNFQLPGAVAEPGSCVMFLIGAGSVGLIAFARRKKRV